MALVVVTIPCTKKVWLVSTMLTAITSLVSTTSSSRRASSSSYLWQMEIQKCQQPPTPLQPSQCDPQEMLGSPGSRVPGMERTWHAWRTVQSSERVLWCFPGLGRKCSLTCPCNSSISKSRTLKVSMMTSRSDIHISQIVMRLVEHNTSKASEGSAQRHCTRHSNPVPVAHKNRFSWLNGALHASTHLDFNSRASGGKPPLAVQG